LKTEGVEPEILVIERVSDPLLLAELERYWIRTLRHSGYRLVNLTDGGEGKLGLKHTDESKRRISETKRQKKLKAEAEGKAYGMNGRSHSQEVKERIAAAQKGRHLSDATKQKLRNIRKGTATRGTGWHHSEATCNRLSEQMQGNKRGAGAVFSDERKNKIRQALTGIKRSEETRRKISESQKLRGDSDESDTL